MDDMDSAWGISEEEEDVDFEGTAQDLLAYYTSTADEDEDDLDVPKEPTTAPRHPAIPSTFTIPPPTHAHASLESLTPPPSPTAPTQPTDQIYTVAPQPSVTQPPTPHPTTSSAPTLPTTPHSTHVPHNNPTDKLKKKRKRDRCLERSLHIPDDP